MRRLRRRVVRSDPSLVLACLVPVCVGIALAGCAASSASEPTSTVTHAGRVAMEDDGLPAQVPPPRSVRQQPVDPAEPYRPHYGSLPSHRRAAIARRLSSTQEDAIIAQAITAHEMRRP